MFIALMLDATTLWVVVMLDLASIYIMASPRKPSKNPNGGFL